jgi:hypothetical protein
MRQLLLGIVAVLISMPSFCAEPSFSLSLSQVGNFPASSKQVRVRIVLRNTSNHAILVTRSPLVDTGDGTGFIFTVHDSQGNTPPETAFARDRMKNAHRSSSRASQDSQGVSLPSGAKLVRPPITRSDTSVEPNATFERRINVSDLYDLTKPSQYTIQIQRRDPDSQTVVKSNAIVVTVPD